MSSAPLPLLGVRILDCTRYLPFSYGSQLLLNLGAEIVKVEPPGGEDGRAMHTTFAAVNAGKRSVTIDLGHPDGAQLFLDLADEADVVYESFRPGVMARFGLSPQAMLARKPGLVVCSATGYGQAGPYAARAGHDGNYLAVAGALLPRPGQSPVLPGLPVADMSSGLFVALSVTAAVLGASRTGIGQHLDLSMTDVALSMNVLAVASGLTGVSGLPWPEIVLGECPCYGTWLTADGRWIMLGNIEPKFWVAFLDEVGLTEFRDDGLATGDRAATVRQCIADVIATDTAAGWEARFSALDVCFSPVHDMAGVRDDPQVRERAMLRQVDLAWTTGFPVRFSAFDPRLPTDVPLAGEANEELFSAVGRDADELARLRADRVI